LEFKDKNGFFFGFRGEVGFSVYDQAIKEWPVLEEKFIKFLYNLKVASVLWPNMQGIGHAAIVNYCKWPITQQIRLQDAPEGFACFEFFLTHVFMRSFKMNIDCKLKLLLLFKKNSKQRMQLSICLFLEKIIIPFCENCLSKHVFMEV
jgi:hypothetical protein